MNSFQKEVIERITRIETKLDNHLQLSDKKTSRRENWKILLVGLVIGIPSILLNFRDMFI